jgi:hypothetical protein
MFSIFYYSCTTRMFLITLVGKRGLQLQRRRSFGGRTRRLEIFAGPKSWNQPLACSLFGVLCRFSPPAQHRKAPAPQAQRWLGLPVVQEYRQRVETEKTPLYSFSSW